MKLRYKIPLLAIGVFLISWSSTIFFFEALGSQTTTEMEINPNGGITYKAILQDGAQVTSDSHAELER